MIIKRFAECAMLTIREVSELDIDMMGFIFWEKSSRYVRDFQQSKARCLIIVQNDMINLSGGKTVVAERINESM